MLQIVLTLENIQLVCNFLLFPTFSLFVSICKVSNFAKFLAVASPAPFPWFLRSSTEMGDQQFENI